MKKKRAITLIEIMIAILLISLIAGVIGYNMKGSLEKGRVMKTKMGMQKLKEILVMESELNNVSLADIDDKKAEELVKNSGLAKKTKDLMQDGWGQRYTIGYDAATKKLNISSARYTEHKNKLPADAQAALAEDDE